MNKAYDTYFQCRTNTKEKEQAAHVLESLGTNLSAVFNMMIRQINLTGSIPFEVKIPDFTDERIINEIKASQAIESNDLTDDDINVIKKYLKSSDKEKFKQNILKELYENE